MLGAFAVCRIGGLSEISLRRLFFFFSSQYLDNLKLLSAIHFHIFPVCKEVNQTISPLTMPLQKFKSFLPPAKYSIRCRRSQSIQYFVRPHKGSNPKTDIYKIIYSGSIKTVFSGSFVVLGKKWDLRFSAINRHF